MEFIFWQSSTRTSYIDCGPQGLINMILHNLIIWPLGTSPIVTLWGNIEFIEVTGSCVDVCLIYWTIRPPLAPDLVQQPGMRCWTPFGITNYAFGFLLIYPCVHCAKYGWAWWYTFPCPYILRLLLHNFTSCLHRAYIVSLQVLLIFAWFLPLGLMRIKVSYNGLFSCLIVLCLFPFLAHVSVLPSIPWYRWRVAPTVSFPYCLSIVFFFLFLWGYLLLNIMYLLSILHGDRLLSD